VQLTDPDGNVWARAAPEAGASERKASGQMVDHAGEREGLHHQARAFIDPQRALRDSRNAEERTLRLCGLHGLGNARQHGPGVTPAGTCCAQSGPTKLAVMPAAARYSANDLIAVLRTFRGSTSYPPRPAGMVQCQIAGR